MEVEVAEDIENKEENLDSEAVVAVVVVTEDAVDKPSSKTTGLSTIDTLKWPCAQDVASQGISCVIVSKYLAADSLRCSRN